MNRADMRTLDRLARRADMAKRDMERQFDHMDRDERDAAEKDLSAWTKKNFGWTVKEKMDQHLERKYWPVI